MVIHNNNNNSRLAQNPNYNTGYQMHGTQLDDMNSFDAHSAMDFSKDGEDSYDDRSYKGGSSLSSNVSDSNDSMVEAKGKRKTKGVGCYTYLKILNGLLYLGTLFIAIAYYTTSKYTSKFVYYAFFGLLVTRPAVIGFYSFVVILLEVIRRKSKASKPWKKSKKDKKKSKKQHHERDLSESQEASEGDGSESESAEQSAVDMRDSD